MVAAGELCCLSDNSGCNYLLCLCLYAEMFFQKCTFCKVKGATIGCVVGACRKVFHFGCGQANDTLHQYFGNFRYVVNYFLFDWAYKGPVVKDTDRSPF